MSVIDAQIDALLPTKVLENFWKIAHHSPKKLQYPGTLQMAVLKSFSAVISFQDGPSESIKFDDSIAETCTDEVERIRTLKGKINSLLTQKLGPSDKANAPELDDDDCESDDTQ
jgi:hypothetical protein